MVTEIRINWYEIGEGTGPESYGEPGEQTFTRVKDALDKARELKDNAKIIQIGIDSRELRISQHWIRDEAGAWVQCGWCAAV